MMIEKENGDSGSNGVADPVMSGSKSRKVDALLEWAESEIAYLNRNAKYLSYEKHGYGISVLERVICELRNESE